MTLRQLYYQFVARGLLENKQANYSRLAGIVSDGRLAGLIDWDAIEDRGRAVKTILTWDEPASILRACAKQYQIDLWAEQDYHVEVWVEKEALLGVIEPVCEELRVNYFACKGYASQSVLHDSAHNRLQEIRDSGKEVIVLHMGDHDPSGIDMTRDITDRVSLFLGADLRVERIALNMPQIRKHNPPPNPAKQVDPRFKDYESQYGSSSWELDALPPDVLSQVIRDNVLQFRDEKLWASALHEERRQQDVLQALSDRFDEVEEFLNDGG
jgi:hypothetical protein